MPADRTLPAALLLAGLCCASAQAATFTVTDAGDAPLGGATHCNPGSTTCTLRAAIERANANIDEDTIAFGFGGVPTTISPATPLPAITYRVTIDGTTNGGTPNSAATGTNAAVTVRIDGANAGADANGIRFHPGASESELRGVAITRFDAAGVLVSANNGSNLHLVKILGNFIGTDGSGVGDDAVGLLANRWGAHIANHAVTTRLGDGSIAGRNLIVARADGESVRMGNGVNGTHVNNNLIGTDRSGNHPRGNAPIGIKVQASQTAITGNVIGAQETGIDIVNESDWNAITSNLIGVGADGSSPIAGSGHGVHIRNIGNVNGAFPRYNGVGGLGAGQGNTIAHWGGNGIRVHRDIQFVAQPQANHWRGNSIHSNGALGIELLDTAFAVGQGADPAQPQPVWAERLPMIASATGTAAGTQVAYTLMDPNRPSKTFRVEAFANTGCDASGYGEGQAFLGAADVQTFEGGGWASTLALPAMPAGHTHVTMTATFIGLSGYHASSEFSRCVAVQMQPAGPGAATPPAVAPGSASAPVGQPFSHALAQYVAGTDGDAIQSHALLGTLPPGMVFDTATGLLHGTPGAPGIYPLMLSATDKDGTASAAFTLTVAGPGGGPGGSGGLTAVPTLGHAALALLSALVAGAGALRRRRVF